MNTYKTNYQPFFIVFSKEYKIKYIKKYEIEYFYQITTDNNNIPAVPDDTVDILFDCSKFAENTVRGTVVLPDNNALLGNSHTYFGITFNSKIYTVLSKLYPAEVINGGIISADDLFGNSSLTREITSTNNFELQIQLFLDSYIPFYFKLTESQNSNILGSEIHKIITDFNGNITAAQIAEKSGYSVRYVNKVFKNTFGIGPKKFIEIYRFQHSANAILTASDIDLTQIAFDLGYYDQSHFIKKFHEFSGFSPGEYRKLILKKTDPNK